MVAIELLLGVHEAMFGGVELRARIDQVIAQIGRVEQRNDLSRLDGIAEANLAVR